MDYHAADSNTWLNYSWVEANGSKFLFLAYVKYIDNTHKLYVFTLAEEAGGRYARAFTWANYWFKNKTTYFGDWVVVQGADSLSSYYAAMANAVNALADKWKSDKGYVPQSYPQIARALQQISRAVTGTRIDLPVDKGYGLVTDFAQIFASALLYGVLVGTAFGVITYWRTGDARQAVMCGLSMGAVAFASSLAPFYGFGWVGSALYRFGTWGGGTLVGWGCTGGRWFSR